MKVALYCRVSTKDQNNDLQRNELVQYAEKMGYDYEIFEEKQTTRKTRPIKEELKHRMLFKREFDGLIVWKLDRWGRSLSELVFDLEDFSQRNFLFISLRDNIDLSSASGRMFANLLSVFANYERDLIQERVLAGLEAAKNRGKKLGRPKGSKDKTKRSKEGYKNNKNAKRC